MVLFEIPGKFRVGYHCTMIARKAPSHIITENEMLIYSVFQCVCVFWLQESHRGCRTHLCTVWYKRV